MSRVALVTCRVMPEPDPDEELLTAALANRGIATGVIPWDSDADFSAYTLAVIRSTWNYVEHHAAFVEWIDRTARQCPVLNPPLVARANLDKRYLGELSARGVPTVPTAFLERDTDLGALLDARGWRDVVIKPVVGAGSFCTARFTDGAGPRARAFVEAELPRRALMVQPYQPSVEQYGERALVWIDGELTHAVRKSPRFTGGHESVSSALPITPAERALAEQALAPHAEALLYARVDVVPAADGSPQIMELELVEPSLFLLQHPPALERFADAIVARVG